ncbi:putative bifunctional diguanylate cyclase/phosphodiesterase [Alkalilimnicola ehrlichii MLHE-1]|uniref:cyclic-guanylate-specific phosphodiesterase n=1 Tax=Alkalilimnicola ehrlichii (strain ATCC BAA-1101 / DSM 17681 / MLHE-1) TaxID=187272 RepID=Q0A7B5_ALKEH|nr:EAL domain-containing protein [Alkalilimnicola ehrlichii]ABI57272.1 diguanylate cyclase/phosphodiesterase with PAS/PAC and GAF sensor(s) [Alkalilimnicola ehrlichii MLHE-1]
MTGVSAQLETQQAIQDLIARHAPLDEILAAITRMIEEHLPGALCSIMLADPEERTLNLSGGHSFSERFCQAMQGIPVGPGIGTCGSAAHERRLVATADIMADRSWNGFHDLARDEGVRACWSVPVIARSGALLGTFATYYRQPGEPTAHDQAQIQRAAGLVALAVERQLDRRALQEAEQRYRSLFTEHPDAVFQVDLEGRLRAANRSATRLIGLPESELLGRHYHAFVFSEDRRRSDAAFEAVCRGKAQHYEVQARTANGSKVELEITNLPIIVDDRVVGIYGIARDVTLRKQYEARLAYYASHDTITGLPNRREFESRLRHDFYLCRQHNDLLAVLYIDLDDFKPVNDSLGHAFGDQLLVAAARRLERLLGPSDTLSRFGGDEFVMLLPGLSGEAEALAVADRVLTLFKRSHSLGRHEVHISASIGIALNHRDVKSPEEMVQFANRAMQQAKQQGRNTWRRYAGELGTRAQGEDISLRRDLQEAIAGDQLMLHYQPVVDAATGYLHSVEALVRWQHPERGLIPPGVFIPLAEQTGQIIDIGHWILHRACRDMADLKARTGRTLPVAVNISPLQFRRPGFLDNLAQVLSESGLPAETLELELTEGVLMADTEATIDTLAALRSLGVHAAIDDFGTGFSSLSYLRYLPIDKVKLDRSFIQDVTNSRNTAAIVQGVITMAHHLELAVVAEGIETEAQRRDLQDRGCDLLQGFFFARPMPLTVLRRRLAEPFGAATAR